VTIFSSNRLKNHEKGVKNGLRKKLQHMLSSLIKEYEGYKWNKKVGLVIEGK
jgi:hypothetical protein